MRFCWPGRAATHCFEIFGLEDYSENMRRKVIFGLSLTVLLLPMVSLAATFIYNDDPDTATEFPFAEQPLQDDVYMVGKVVLMERAVDQDVFAAGQDVSIGANVAGDVHAAGETVSVVSTVGDDVYVAGFEVTLRANVRQGDIFAAGNRVDIGVGPETNDAADVVGKNIYVAGQHVTIDTLVGGSVWAAADEIRITSGSVIRGNLYFTGPEKPVIEEGAKIEGEIVHTFMQGPTRTAGRAVLISWVRSVVSLFVLSLVMVYGARAFTRAVTGTVAGTKGKSLLTSILWLLLFIPAAVILLITMVGIPLAVGLVLLTILASLAATGIVAAALGRWIMGKLTKDSGIEFTWVHALVGAVVYKGVQLLPVVGWLATAVLVLFFFGATVLTFVKLLRNHDSAGTSVGTTQPIHEE